MDEQRQVEAVFYRGSRGLIGEVYLSSELPDIPIEATPLAVLELLGEQVIRFANIEAATRYLLEFRCVVTRATVI